MQADTHNNSNATTNTTGPHDEIAAWTRVTLSQLDIYKKLELGVGQDLWRTKSNRELGIPSLCMSDGPSGLRYQPSWMPKATVVESIPATCFPSLANLGSTWDKDLAQRMGQAIGEEARSFGVDVVLGPGINLKRSPLGGRNFEYFSEDPLLTGILATSYVNGVQQTGTGACVKHFCANSQEYKRFSSSSEIDIRTLRELYLRAFEMVVRDAKPEMLMSAYPQVNGVYCSDNASLLRDVLRTEWGFEGVVVSDWGGMHSRAEAYKASCDLAMPGGSHHAQRAARLAIRAGELNKLLVDESVERLLKLAKIHESVSEARNEREFKARMSEPVPAFERGLENVAGHTPDNLTEYTEERDAAAKHRKLAYEVACASQVLLKNNGALPLKVDAKICLVGAMAAHPRIQGAGSSRVNPRKATSLRSVVQAHGLEWLYCMGCKEDGTSTKELIDEAKHQILQSDAAIVCVAQPASFEGEGFDRPGMQLSDETNRLVEELIATAHEDKKPMCVLVYGGGAVELPWADKADAILWVGLAGEAGAEATFSLLAGEVSPSGKLAESWPYSAEDAPCSEAWHLPSGDAHYREGLYLGYRYYVSAGKKPAFPFGHGLSYTDFEYSQLELDTAAQKLRFTLKNRGEIAASEVVQAYVSPLRDEISTIENNSRNTAAGTQTPLLSEPYRPHMQLAAFSRVGLEAGESMQVELQLDTHAFEVWDEAKAWTRLAGTYEIRVGASSEDIRLSEKVQVDGLHLEAPRWQAGTWYEHLQGKPSHEDFVALLGREPYVRAHERGGFDETDSLRDLARVSRLCRLVAQFAEQESTQGLEGLPEDDPAVRMMKESSGEAALFSVVNGSGGQFPEALSKALISIANGKIPNRFRAH